MLDVLSTQYDVHPGERRMIGLGVRLMLGTGQRVSEVLEADWAEWHISVVPSEQHEGDPVVAVWTIPGARRKQRTTHEVYVPWNLLRLVLTAHGLEPTLATGKLTIPGIPAAGPLLPDVSTRWRSGWTRTLFDVTAARGVTPWTLRDLRRT